MRRRLRFCVREDLQKTSAPRSGRAQGRGGSRPASDRLRTGWFALEAGLPPGASYLRSVEKALFRPAPTEALPARREEGDGKRNFGASRKERFPRGAKGAACPRKGYRRMRSACKQRPTAGPFAIARGAKGRLIREGGTPLPAAPGRCAPAGKRSFAWGKDARLFRGVDMAGACFPCRRFRSTAICAPPSW